MFARRYFFLTASMVLQHEFLHANPAEIHGVQI